MAFRLLIPTFILYFMILSPATEIHAYTDRILAIINKDVITFSELQEEVRDEHIRLKARYAGKSLKRRMAAKDFQVLNRLIEERLQLQEAEAKGFSVTDEELVTARQQSSTKAADTSDDEAKTTEHLRKRILLQKIRAFEVRRIVTISDMEISKYYREHQQLFMVSHTYRLRQILLMGDSEEERIHKQSQARSISRRLQSGESFRELALQYSSGPEAADGGELGTVQHDELHIPIAEALLTMKPNEISEPIETALGFHIIALDERTPQTPKPLEEVEDQIKTKLFKERSEQVFQHWIADLKKKAFIEIKFSPLANF